MTTQNFLKYFSYTANISSDQTKQLFALCNNDIEALLEMQAKRKANNIFYTPGNKEELNKILNLKLK